MFKTKFSKFVSTLLSRAMPKLIDPQAVRAARSGRIRSSPWVKIPNVGKFQVNLGAIDVLFALFGYKRRVNTTLEIQPYKNNKMNKYVIHQIKRLEKFRKYPKKYFFIANCLIKNSDTFRIMGINHVFRQWHRKYPLWMIMKTNERCQKLIKDQSATLEITRAYVPKGNGSWRPLGVPKLEWRLLLHMHSQFITFFLQEEMKDLHGFLPSKGIVTAWKCILNGLLKRKYIYEWDFKGFFDQVSIPAISHYLRKLQVPETYISWLEAINRCPVKLLEKDLIDETAQRRQQAILTDLMTPGTPANILAKGNSIGIGKKRFSHTSPTRKRHIPLNPSWEVRTPSVTYNVPPLEVPEKWLKKAKEHMWKNVVSNLNQYIKDSKKLPPTAKRKEALDMVEESKDAFRKAIQAYKGEPGPIRVWIRTGHALLPDPRADLPMPGGTKVNIPRAEAKEIISVGYQGVPQGAATSPILSNLVMLAWHRQCQKAGVTLVSYADDSVGFSDLPIEVEAPPEHGIIIEPKKSGYVKFAGNELKPLKFLGLEIERNFVRAHTRKGSRLAPSYKELLLGELFLELNDKCQTLSAEDALDLLENTIEEQKLYPEVDKSFIKIFNSRLSGWFLSRMQAGSWNLENLTQDFRMTFIQGSWAGTKLNKWELDIFNASSLANYSLLNMLRYGKRRKRADSTIRFIIT